MPDLPSGTVAFLFTDIEGSSALWERDRQAMAAAVARHLALLDAAIQAHGGIRFKTIGDAVQAAFPTAPGAIAASVDAQLALFAEDWSEIGALRVRMAVHAGEADPDESGDYLSPPLNRLSRLLATGHGGQILLSQAAVDALVSGPVRQSELASDLTTVGWLPEVEPALAGLLQRLFGICIGLVDALLGFRLWKASSFGDNPCQRLLPGRAELTRCRRGYQSA